MKASHTNKLLTVSYTHLDVYKRQVLDACRLLHARGKKLILEIDARSEKERFCTAYPEARTGIVYWKMCIRDRHRTVLDRMRFWSRQPRSSSARTARKRRGTISMRTVSVSYTHLLETLYKGRPGYIYVLDSTDGMTRGNGHSWELSLIHIS